MSRKAPSPPPPEGIVKPPGPPGPPKPKNHWVREGRRLRMKTPVESSPGTVVTLVYLHLGKQGIQDMITAVHEWDGLTNGGADLTGGKEK